MEAIDPVVLQRLVDDLARENADLRAQIRLLEQTTESLQYQLDDSLCGTGGTCGECAS